MLKTESESYADIPFREVPYLPLRLSTVRRPDGTTILENRHPLKSFPPNMLAPIVYWANEAPDRVWLAQRNSENPNTDGWDTVTYQQALEQIKSFAQGFLNENAGPDCPVMILSRNSIENALVMYGAMWAGSPVVPVTPAYALLSKDLSRLKYIDQLTQPKIVYVDDGEQYQRGIDGMEIDDRLVLYRINQPKGCRSLALTDFGRTPTDETDTAYERLRPQNVAKYMLTSGSTGEPKAVINTHENIAANAKMIRSVWDEDRLAEVSGEIQVMCNFLPWSHTYGANAILHNLADWGGTLYIDWGAPTKDRLGEMLRNLQDVSPTQHTTVPAAWAALATEFERNQKLADSFFKNIVVMAYGGASMGQDIYERIQKVAVAITGTRISLSAGYGATETAPTASNVHWPNDTMGLIGLPLPGNSFKLVPVGEKTELRIKGVNVTPGYYRNPDKTAESFDEEGYYKIGDAVRLVDPLNPERGLAFDGRIAEEFKLSSGTWVSTGTVRVKVIEEVDGALLDVVVCGLNRTEICLLGFLNEAWCRRFVGETVELKELVVHPEIREIVARGISRYNAKFPNNATRIARILLENEMPQLDKGEITEKGYINQNKTLEIRRKDVDRLYDSPFDKDVMEISPLAS